MNLYDTIQYTVLSPGGENVCNFIPGTLSCSCRSNQSVINKVLQNNRTMNKGDVSFSFSGLDAIFVLFLFLCSSSRIQSFLLDRLANQQVQCWYANHLLTFKMAQSSHLEGQKSSLPKYETQQINKNKTERTASLSICGEKNTHNRAPGRLASFSSFFIHRSMSPWLPDVKRHNSRANEEALLCRVTPGAAWKRQVC